MVLKYVISIYESVSSQKVSLVKFVVYFSSHVPSMYHYELADLLGMQF